MFHVPNSLRLTKGALASTNENGNNGAFLIPPKIGNRLIRTIASDGGEWEHVSVSLACGKMPNWEEMCYVKDIFWDEEDAVIQLHPKKSEYVNVHDRCLHLWRPKNQDIPTPPKELV